MIRDRVVTDYTIKGLKIQNEGKWPKDGTLGDPTSQKWRRWFLLRSQLLPVSYLVGKNGRSRQDHEYRKCFRSESEYLPLVSAWFNPQHKQHAHSNKTHEYNTIRHVQNKQQPYSKTLWVRGELLHDPVVHWQYSTKASFTDMHFYQANAFMPSRRP